MKPTQLQVGDYVRLRRTKEIVWVFEIDDDRNVINNEPDGYCSEKNIDIDDVEPIPLTSEILELNGFHHEDFGYSLVTTDDKSFLLLGVFSGGTYLWHEAKIYYVHELQHALRLCGLNELADNFRMEE